MLLKMQGFKVHLSEGALCDLNKQDGTLEVETADPTLWQDAPCRPLLGFGGRDSSPENKHAGDGSEPFAALDQTANGISCGGTAVPVGRTRSWHAPPRTGSALGVSELVELSMT